jgi:hypothetical protein
MSVPAEVQKVNQEVPQLADQAKMILVKDQETLAKANDFFLVIRQMRKKIGDIFNPIIEAAKEAKRKADDTRAEAVRQKEKVEEPLVRAESWLNGQIGDYKRDQDRIRQAEEDRLRKIAIEEETKRRKEEEARKMAEAQALEEAGAHAEAEQMVEEAIQAVEEPIIPKIDTLPKITLDGMTERVTWHAEVFSLKELCLAIGQGRTSETFVTASLPNLNRMAIAQRGNMRVPGVKAVSESKMVPTGR